MITTLGKGQWRVGVSIVGTSLLHVAYLMHVRCTRICSAIVYVHRAHILASSARSVRCVCITHGIGIEEVACLVAYSCHRTWSHSRAQQRVFARINAIVAHLTLEYTRQHLTALALLTVYWIQGVVATNHYRILRLCSLPRQQLTNLVTLAIVQVNKSQGIINLHCIIRMCASLISNDNTIFQCQWGSVLDIGIELHVTRCTHLFCYAHGRGKRATHKAEKVVIHQLPYWVCRLACVVSVVYQEKVPVVQNRLVSFSVLKVWVASRLIVFGYIVVAICYYRVFQLLNASFRLVHLLIDFRQLRTHAGCHTVSHHLHGKVGSIYFIAHHYLDGAASLKV